MKRGILVLVLAAFVAGGVFAQVQLSAGGGLLFDGGRVGGAVYEYNVPGEAYSLSYALNHFGFGGWVFFDATFAQLSIAFMGGPARFGGIYSCCCSSHEITLINGSFLALDISLLGRVPFTVGDGNISIFPLFGFGYNLVLSSSGDHDDDEWNWNMIFELFNNSAADLSTFRIKLGFGSDFDINESLFFRAQVLGYYRFAPRLFRDWVEEDAGLGPNERVFHQGGFGGSIKLGIGFRL